MCRSSMVQTRIIDLHDGKMSGHAHAGLSREEPSDRFRAAFAFESLSLI